MRLTILAPVLLLAAGCHKEPQAAVVPPLPKVEIADIHAPASASVTVQSGATLIGIAETAYGHEEFSGFVGVLNGVTSPQGLQAGAVLQTPSLPIAFRDAGLDPLYQPAIGALAKAWQDLQAVLPDYIKARDASGLYDGKTFTISQELRSKLNECANMIDAALASLKHPSSGHHAPQKTIGKFASVSTLLRRLSTGHIKSRDYDAFELQQDMGLGFTYALIWTKEHHQ